MKREKKFKEDISRLEREMQGLKHNHEVDLMRVAQEYEEKLQGLFDHSSIGQMLLQEVRSHGYVTDCAIFHGN